MDDLTAQALGVDLNAPPPAPVRAVGRPAITAEQRAVNDAKYREMQEVLNVMPQAAKEPKFAIFRARMRIDQKKGFKALIKIPLNEWKEKGFEGPDTLQAQAAFCNDRWGEGRYWVEAIDAMGMRIPKVAGWIVATPGYSEEDMDDYDDDFDDEDDDLPRSRRRRRRYRDDDDDFDDPRDRKLNIADFLLASGRNDQQAVGKVVDSSQNTLALLMHTSQQQESARREEALRREEMDRRRQDEQAKRDDERRREQERADDKRREDARERERQEDIRRSEQTRISIEASNQRMQMMMGAITLLAPKLFEKRENPVEHALMASLTAKKETDPITLMIMKNFLDAKAQPVDPMNGVISAMIEMQKMGNTMNVESTKQILALNGEVTKTLVTKILENAGDGNGKNMMEQIVDVLGSATEMVNKLMPAPAAAPTAYQQMATTRQQQIQQQQQARIAQQQQQQAAQGAAAPADAQAAAAAPAQPVANDQQLDAFNQAIQANPTLGVLSTLFSIQSKAWSSQQEYQGLVEYAVQCMPIDLRVAVLDNNEAQVLQLVMPTINAYDRLKAWASDPAVGEWLREYVPQLAQPIEAIYGPAAKQREEYVELLARSQAAHAAQAAQAAQDTQAPPAAALGTEAQAAPAEGGPVPTPEEGGPAVGDVAPLQVDDSVSAPKADEQSNSETIQFPGSAAPAPAASHLDDPDAP